MNAKRARAALCIPITARPSEVESRVLELLTMPNVITKEPVYSSVRLSEVEDGLAVAVEICFKGVWIEIIREFLPLDEPVIANVTPARLNRIVEPATVVRWGGDV